MTPRFSILIPTYNRAAFLPETLASVFAQTFSDYEIIVIDDGSSDHTLDVLSAYEPQVQVLRQDNRGPGAARNLGLRSARGEYVVFLDSDDLFLPWTLSIFDEGIRRHDTPAMLMCAPCRFSADDPLEARETPAIYRAYSDYLASARAYYPVTIAAAIRREVLASAGGFLEHHHCAEDQDLFLRLGEAEGFVFVEGPPLYAYRQHGASKSHEIDALYRGAILVLGREERGVYAGGRARYPDRAIILARKCRFGVKRFFAYGCPGLGYRLLVRSLPHILAAGHWRDLYRLPLLSLPRAKRRAQRPVTAPKQARYPSEG